MPKSLMQYRVFIGSPGGLSDERECFRNKLEKFSALHAESLGAIFHPVGWEDTIGGVGRPQGLINEDLKQCDYAVFVLHDRWGSPTGGGYTSGTEEEWTLAEELYKDNKIRNIALFFKGVDARQLRDPGIQLKAVLTFKRRIEEEKRYLFKQYDAFEEFVETLEGHLTRWLRDHGAATSNLSATGLVTGATGIRTPVATPQFDYWVAEVDGSLKTGLLDSLRCLILCQESSWLGTL